ncbi:hypothetical protein H6G27_09880 [Nostoc linckia FACHB-104]|nr:hypothetical protein [Nostoc linckia FACHB-104]
MEFKTLIAARTDSPTFSVSLETVSISLGIVVSLTVIGTVAVKVITKFNSLAEEIKDLREDLKEYKETTEQIKSIQKEVTGLDKRLDLLVQEHHNRVEAVNLIARQLDEKIGHKFGRLAGSMRDVEKFLQSQGIFKMHEYEND